MIRYWLEKTWVQYTVLATIVAAAAYYWGFIFQFGYKFDWSVLFIENATYHLHFGVELLKAALLTIKISMISAAIALALGIVFGLGRLSSFKPMQALSGFYVEFFRNTPLLVQLFFWYFALPQALPEGVRQWLYSINFEFWVATVGLSVYTGSFMAEVIRAGLQSIPKGLLEAAYSSGLTYLQVLRRIILPIAFRNIIPPLGSEFLNNMKNSSLAIVVGVAELCWQSQQVESLTFRGFEATTAATVLYLLISLGISGIMNAVNRNLKVGSETNRPLSRRLLGRAFAAVVVPVRRTVQLVTLRRGLPRTRQSLELTPAQAFWLGVGKKAWQVLVLLAKVALLGSLAYVAFVAVRGIVTLDWDVVMSNQRLLLIWRFPHGSENEVLWGLGGLSMSIVMAVFAITVSFPIGILAGVARTSENKLYQIPATVYIECIRGVPLIMVIFWTYFFIPILTHTFIDVFWSASIALTVFTGAYLAEIVRAGIQNIPPGQMEAALSTGLTYSQAMRKVILPQALKQMIPAIVGQFIAIFKDTSLAYIIGVLELTFVAMGLNNRLMVHPFEVWVPVAIYYFVCCYAMSTVARKIERHLSTDVVRLEM